jgi:hypothetical protein
MHDPTAQTEPLTAGQQIVAAWETDIIAEPCELAECIDQRIAAEREACASKAREFAAHYPVGSDGRNTFIILAEWIENRL